MNKKSINLTLVLFLMSSAALNAQTVTKPTPEEVAKQKAAIQAKATAENEAAAKRKAETEAALAQQKANAQAKVTADIDAKKVEAADKAAAAQIYELIAMSNVNRFMAAKLSGANTKTAPDEQKKIEKIKTYLNTSISAESMNSTFSDAEINTLSAYVVNTKGAQKNNFTKFSGTNFGADAAAVTALDKSYTDIQNAITKRKAYLKTTTYPSILSKANAATL